MKKLVFVLGFMMSLSGASAQNLNDRIADPSEMSLSGHKGGVVTVDEFLNFKEIESNDRTIRVKSFRFTVKKGNDLIQLEGTENGMVTDRMKQALLMLGSGSEVYIEYIQVINSEGLVFAKRPLNFKIQ